MKTLPQTRRYPVRVLEELEKYEKLSPCLCSMEAYSHLMQRLRERAQKALLAEHYRSITFKDAFKFGILGILVNERVLKIDLIGEKKRCEICKQKASAICRISNFRPQAISLCIRCGEKLPLPEGWYYLNTVIPQKLITEVCEEVYSILVPYGLGERIKSSICILGEAEIFKKAIDPLIGIWTGNRIFLLRSYKPTRTEKVLLSLAE
jgi:hypothetical protein